MRGSDPNPFFAMDTAMVKTLGTPLQAADIELVAQLGYAGIGPIAGTPAEWERLIGTVLPLLDQHRLKLFAVYSSARVSNGGFEVDSGITEHLASLKPGTIVWLPITSKDFQPSDPAGDEQAAAAVRQVADTAAAHGCSVGLYPHFGNLMQRVSDAVRICTKAAHKNAGVTFNLCHWLRTDGPNNVSQVLELARPYLSVVTINGADRDGKDWPQLIQPLDQGTFDIGSLLKELRRLDYRGPIGLQGYDVANNFHIEPAENLRRSMAAWKKLTAQTA
jgi:sugar phosphate isomerase/epimerase